MNNSIPVWVQDAFDAEIAFGNYYERCGDYVFNVSREECGRRECIIEVWEGRIDAGTFNRTYNGEPDPTKQKDDLTWRDLIINQL